MPPKARRATNWRQPTSKETLRPLRTMDVDGLWREVQRLMPEFCELPHLEQQIKIRLLAVKLAEETVQAEAQRTRPTPSSMKRNIGDLVTTIRAVRDARAALDVDSKYLLLLTAVEQKFDSRDEALQRSELHWAEFDVALQNAERWAQSAFETVPKRAAKSTRRLDSLMFSLAVFYESGTSGRRAVRSAKRGGFLDFAMSIVKFAPSPFCYLSRDQLDGSIRRVLPMFQEASYYAKFGRLPW